jgi:predicted TIM-barrel fold metal-dependent hydrolase
MRRLYFDSFAVVGKQGIKDKKQIWRAEDVLKLMEYSGINMALVYHGLAVHHAPIYGNRILLDELKKNLRLVGCWIAIPHHTGELPHPDDFVKEMRDNNIKAVKIFPKQYMFSLRDEVCGELFACLEKNRIPLLIDIVETNFDNIFSLCSRYKNLKIFLQKCHWNMARDIFPLMERYKNLYIEFSSFQGNMMIEEMCRRFGSKRLLLGTEMPLKSPGASRAAIDYADISEEDKQNIGGGNLAEILGVKIEPYEKEPKGDSVLSKIKKGEPLCDILIIDGHAHVLDKGEGGAKETPMLLSDIDSMITQYDRLGIDKVCISGAWLGVLGGDSEQGNKIVKNCIAKYPDRVIGSVTLDPNYVEKIEDYVKYWHGQDKFWGLKPYYTCNRIPYIHSVYTAWFQYANKHRLFILCHEGEPNFDNNILSLSEKYSEVSFLLAHTGERFSLARRRIALVRKRPNIYLEITYTNITQGIIEFMVDEVGSQKIIFGTDTPMRSPIPQLAWVAYADITEEDKKNILGRNMQKIIERVGSFIS